MKTWKNAEIEELNIKATANGLAESDFFDGPWVEIDGIHYRPGNGTQSANAK